MSYWLFWDAIGPKYVGHGCEEFRTRKHAEKRLADLRDRYVGGVLVFNLVEGLSLESYAP
jgi:hypothetical protein